MHASADRLEFAPPPQPAALRAFVLAIIAHLLLMLALTWGINWNRETENVVAEAELWASVPQQAAPKVVEAPPPPPQPTPEVKAPPPPPPVQATREPDIALEREKKRKELVQLREEELERQKKIETRKKLEDQKRELTEKLKREQLAEQKAADERRKQEVLAKAAREKASQQLDSKKMEALREENLRRMQGMAGATGGPTSTGTAARSAGFSASYAGRIAARIKPNIVFSEVITGNSAATVEIRVAPDGTIIGRKLVESSGVKSWDDAVLRAIDKTEILPRDTDGSVQPQFPIRFRPRD